ncbi:GTP 3',8-cyclase MoaA [Maribacter chungangensis]|uniref:GTP 3',8-cyclase n=1 Tax=Maribacter chungangensis TaxID=1069117 RepID=A0ABW3B8A5_9FLAO
MTKPNTILTDTFGREHTYLRISLTERCNLRCTYCMPADGIALSPKSHIMTYEEIYTIAKEFVEHGVTKIRLTGGEPLVRKDVGRILEQLASLPVELAITTNGVIVHRFIDLLKKIGLKKINVSLDSLNNDKNTAITRRDYFTKVHDNIQLLVKEGFEVKVNCVLIKGFNDNEIVDFIELTKTRPLQIRFIEFMPFDGNKWNLDKLVSLEEVLKEVYAHYDAQSFIRLKDAPNDTAKNYQIKGYAGSFAVISSVTNPFCDSCNRIRLTANGQLKNCLFSTSETDLLTPLREGKSIVPVIQKAVGSKKKIRSGMETLEQFKDPDSHNNRSMIAIGG